MARIHRSPLPALVLLELSSTRNEGLRTLQLFRQVHPEVKIVVLATSGDNRQVVEAIRMGAHDYLISPFPDFELLDVVNRHAHANGGAEIAAAETVEKLGGEHFFFSASVRMNKLRMQAELLANIDVPVLILGESGTGKEVIAQLIHKLSARSQRPFLKVNCAALPGELLESELFGYERGAFTGATRTRAGKFELCDKGTILLDEIAEMPANLQAKLLHVLQDKQFFRLGGESTLEVDVRVLAATNVDINQAMAERKFREDLYYRLSAFTIFLPPLRERQEEIPGLLRHFMQRVAAEYSRVPIPFSTRLVNACLQYSWPGNLRELQNFVKRYLVMGDEGMALDELQVNRCRRLGSASSPSHTGFRAAPAPKATSAEERGPDLKDLIRTVKEEAEIEAITKALTETNWNRKKAAGLLQISYRGLLYKIRQHAILPPPLHQPPKPSSHPKNIYPGKTFAHAAAVGNQMPNGKA